MAGIDATGFTKKTLDEIRDSLRDSAKNKFGSTINVSEDSVLGQLIDVQAEQIADAWNGLEGVYEGFNPSTAEDVPLDNVVEYVGIQRLAAEESKTTVIVTGNLGITITVGSLISVTTTGSQFSVDVSETLTLLDPTNALINIDNVLDNTLYTITINGTAITFTSDGTATLNEITAGLSLAINLSSENGNVTAIDNIDGTITVNSDGTITSNSLVPDSFLLAIDANMSINKISTGVAVTSIVTGVIAAPIGTLVNIDTPIFNWDSVTNPDAATLGRDVETDTSLRQRRFESVQIAGAGTAPSIEANVRQVASVTDAFIIENRDIVPDAAGRPGKSFETIVQGGDEQEIAQEIWDNKPAGIETFGSINRSVTDSQSNAQVINFSRPTTIFVHLQIDYTKFSEEIFPTSGEDAIKTTALKTGNALTIGEDVITQRFFGDIFSAVDGIATLEVRQAVSATEFGPPGAFSTDNLVIDGVEISNFVLTRITVNEV